MRNVRWYEAGQDRASESKARMFRAANRWFDRATVAYNEMRKQESVYTKVARKRQAAAMAEWQRCSARGRDLHDRAYARQKSGNKWGRAKTHIGTHTSFGWIDRVIA